MFISVLTDGIALAPSVPSLSGFCIAGLKKERCVSVESLTGRRTSIPQGGAEENSMSLSSCICNSNCPP